MAIRLETVEKSGNKWSLRWYGYSDSVTSWTSMEISLRSSSQHLTESLFCYITLTDSSINICIGGSTVRLIRLQYRTYRVSRCPILEWMTTGSTSPDWKRCP